MTLIDETRLGPYEILSRIGFGGMGEVYRARDTRLDRTVAIKVLPIHLTDNDEFRQRFEREARAVSSLNHPHICIVHDIGHQDGFDFLVMEFIEGESLADRLAKGALPAEQVLRYGIQIASALDKAHRAGIVHRDLKPGNIMLNKSGTKLLDFGLAKFQGSGAFVGAAQLTWFDRSGKSLELLGDLARYLNLHLSPDDKWAAVSIVDRKSGNSDIWLYETERDGKIHFTSNPASERVAVWSHDMRRIVFNSNRNGNFDLYEKAFSGTGSEELLFESESSSFPSSLSPDGRFLIYETAGGKAEKDLWALPLSGDQKLKPFRLLRRSSLVPAVRFLPTDDGSHTPQMSLKGVKSMWRPFRGRAAGGRSPQPAAHSLNGGEAMERRFSIWPSITS